MAKDATLALWSEILESFAAIAVRYDSYWQKRFRALDTQMLMEMIFKIVISQNRQGQATSLDDFWQKSLLLGGLVTQVTPVAASTFCEARQKLSEQCFKDFNDAIVSAFEAATPAGDERYSWRGHRIFAIDSSSLNLPPALKAAGFRLPTPDSHYPQAMLSCLYNLKSQQPADPRLVKHRHEQRLAREHLRTLRPGDVVVYDRAYLSFALVGDHLRLGPHGVWRVKSGGTFKEIVAFWASNDIERLVELKPVKSNKPPVRLRLVKYVVGDKTFCLATTLLCSSTYPVSALADLYHARWGIEELYKVSKHHFEIEQFRSLSLLGIRQEVYAQAALISLARVLTNVAEQQLSDDLANTPTARTPGKPAPQAVALKVNFKHAIHLVRINVEQLLHLGGLHGGLRHLLRTILRLIMRSRVRLRPGRHYERRSKKPISRWQKNIHKQWRKKKREATLARCA